MLDVYTVCFFGHRRLDKISSLEKQLDEIVSRLIKEKEYVEFLIGHEGEFDELCASVIRGAKRKYSNGNCELNLILPYSKSGIDDKYESYDNIEVCADAAQAHFKTAIYIRNRCMCERSDLAVCYATHEGGAYSALEYAKSLGIETIELQE